MHILIAADVEDAMNYVGDPQYDQVHYVSDPHILEGLQAHEVSFTPRATNYPHWMKALQIMQRRINATTGNWRGRIHYIPLYEDGNYEDQSN